MWTLTLDQWVTRRKFYAVVHDPQGDYQFKAKRAGDCLEHLWALEIDQFEILSDNSRWRVQVARVGDRED